MIVIEYNDRYEYIKQHDHALLAGEMAMRASKSPFKQADYRMVMTVALHDASWKESDNEFTGKPIHFVNYPMDKKLKLYKNGIDTIEKIDEYVALLTSLHYTAFFNPEASKEIAQFLSSEKKRQNRLQALFPKEDVQFALQELKMWDNFSLYVCLNKPGVKKEDEHPWFKKGIKATSAKGKSITVDCQWVDSETVAFSPSPFHNVWTATIPVYIVEKSDLKKPHRMKLRSITFTEF